MMPKVDSISEEERKIKFYQKTQRKERRAALALAEAADNIAVEDSNVIQADLKDAEGENPEVENPNLKELFDENCINDDAISDVENDFYDEDDEDDVSDEEISSEQAKSEKLEKKISNLQRKLLAVRNTSKLQAKELNTVNKSLEVTRTSLLSVTAARVATTVPSGLSNQVQMTAAMQQFFTLSEISEASVTKFELQLRSYEKDGQPWDREQVAKSLKGEITLLVRLLTQLEKDSYFTNYEKDSDWLLHHKLSSEKFCSLLKNTARQQKGGSTTNNLSLVTNFKDLRDAVTSNAIHISAAKASQNIRQAYGKLILL
mgnify:CR=1 FL=1